MGNVEKRTLYRWPYSDFSQKNRSTLHWGAHNSFLAVPYIHVRIFPGGVTGVYFKWFQLELTSVDFSVMSGGVVSIFQIGYKSGVFSPKTIQKTSKFSSLVPLALVWSHNLKLKHIPDPVHLAPIYFQPNEQAFAQCHPCTCWHHINFTVSIFLRSDLPRSWQQGGR